MTPADLERLAHLPREPELDGAEWAAEYTRRYSRTPHAPTQTLRPIQGLMLAQAERAGGLVALAACGEGKTLASLLLPAVLGAKRAIILLPAAMRAQYLGDRESYGAHWHLVPMEPMSYEGLSSPAQVARLEELAPDLVVCDEAHNLKNLKSARTRRLEAYLARSGAKLCALSGTLVSRSLREYAPVMNWALGPWSPLPRENAHIETWAQVVEEGALDRAARGWFERAHEGLEGSYEQRLHQRLRASRGVVITKSQEVGASLVIERRRFKSERLKDAVARLLATQDVVSATHDVLDAETLARVTESRDLWTPQDAVYSRVWAQLQMGVVYTWDWGGRAPDTEWITARRAWSGAVSWALANTSFDSEALLVRAVQEGAYSHPRVTGALRAWSEVRDREPPATHPVWVDTSWVEDVAAWARAQSDPPLVWVQLAAIGHKLAELTGFATYGAGSEASALLESSRHTAHPAIVSIAAHGTGKNLQAWGNQIIAHPLAHPARWEQMLARTHRPGQARDEVRATVYTHGLFGRALSRARADARYVFETTGQTQKITSAAYILS